MAADEELEQEGSAGHEDGKQQPRPDRTVDTRSIVKHRDSSDDRAAQSLVERETRRFTETAPTTTTSTSAASSGQ